MKRGRPPKLDAEKKQTLFDMYFRSRMTASQIAGALGISRRLLYNTITLQAEQTV